MAGKFQADVEIPWGDDEKPKAITHASLGQEQVYVDRVLHDESMQGRVGSIDRYQLLLTNGRIVTLIRSTEDVDWRLRDDGE